MSSLLVFSFSFKERVYLNHLHIKIAGLSAAMAHLYNKLLPTPVADEMEVESQRFHLLVQVIQKASQNNSLASRLASLKWISVVNTFLKAKSTSVTDIESLAKAALDILLMSSDHLYIQTRWANCLARLLSKHGKELNLEIEWRPLYNLLLNTHFRRRPSYEGIRLKFSHLDNLIYLTEACRRFFKAGSCAEIWSEFRPKFDDISHNSALEAAGFVSLFLPTKSQKTLQIDQPFFTRAWLAECLDLWSAIPSCHYWNVQWASVLSRCIKHQVMGPFDWEPFLPRIFTQFLNAFDVPIGKAGTRSPVHRTIPVEIKHAFNASWSPGLSTLISKSIVYLLSPCGSAQAHFNTMIDFLEQYYHPSNGGSWTGSLQRLLRLLVFYFLKRLAHERNSAKGKGTSEAQFFLGSTQREAFVKSVMKLIDRGQYSKNSALAWTAASAASRLSYVEPSIVLPLVISRFHTALETITATHQLESALRMLALSVRALWLHDFAAPGKSLVTSKTCLAEAMFSTLPGLDANDPPKTLATMQLYCAVLSSVGKAYNEGDLSIKTLPIDWSLWVDKFFECLFSLLVNLEPNGQPSDDVASDNGFLIEKGSMYPCLIELLFTKMSESQYNQVLKKIVKFVIGNILPGAIGEVGLLCCKAVSANPKVSGAELLSPIMNSLLSLLLDSPKTGFSGSEGQALLADCKLGLSPALELTIQYHLGVLSKAVSFGGAALPAYKSLVSKVISAAFDMPSSKATDAGSTLLIAAVGSMIIYYPISSQKDPSYRINSEGFEEWISSKNSNKDEELCTSIWWHVPDHEELNFVNDIVDWHLRKPLATLKTICEEGYKSTYSGQEKEHMRVLLLRVEAVLCGLGSCLPDFYSPPGVSNPTGGEHVCPMTIVGASGPSIASAKLREETAEIIHQVCEYILKNRGDDYALLKIIVSIMDMLGNYGSVEYYQYLDMKGSWDASARSLSEPCTNFINNTFCDAKRRPWWCVVERIFIHNMWRASQAGYRCYNSKESDLFVPIHISMISKDLLRLSLHSYSGVRSIAGRNLKSMLQRYPMLVQECMPLLTKSLQDPKSTKESAIGSCQILMSRPVMRHLRQDWTALVSFLLALLGSAHHESIEAQDAINELFIMFNTCFGGIPAKTCSNPGERNDNSECMTYSSMVSYVRDLLKGDTITIHWRYNLMAHGILLFLVLPVSYNEKLSEEGTVSNLRCAVAGGFLSNLKSEFPPLRPLSVIALLFILETNRRKEVNSRGSMSFSIQGMCHSKGQNLLSENSMETVLHDKKFCENVINKLAVDRQSVEDEGFSTQQMSDAGLTSFMPTYMREWPHTRTWEHDMEGEQFSPAFAKLFKRLVQEFGSTVLNILNGPLEEAVSTEDRGKQCIAAEIMAGLLHSDAECVIASWDEWIRPLLLKYLLLPAIKSAPEWAACIRFAVGGKGRDGNRVPMLRYKILQCVAEQLPEKSSTSLIAKRLMFLRAALLELLPVYSLPEEISFQRDLLDEVLHLIGHPAPQVRKSVGSLLCLLLSNLHLFSQKQLTNGTVHVEARVAEQTCSLLMNKAMVATKIIINADQSMSDAVVSGNTIDGVLTKANKESVKEMESMLYFLVAAIRSGREHSLMNAVVGLIFSALSLQETSEKALSAVAKTAMRYIQWQLFPLSHLPQVVEVALAAANDSNWHTRVAFLTFLQPFMFRHKFILSSTDLKSLWEKVVDLISDTQLEVREVATTTLSGMMKGAETTFANPFRQKIVEQALLLKSSNRRRRLNGEATQSIASIHGIVLSLSAIILSVPYDIPRWLPDMVTLLAEFANEPWPVRRTVTKTIGDFRHTHSDVWEYQKDSFTDQQLEVLSNLTSSATYFA